jgi:hypothetical protein
MLFHSIQGAGGFAVSSSNSITYNNDYLVAKGSTTVTFTGVDFGTESSDRVVAVYISSGTLNLGTVSGVTIGGISATLAVTANTTNSNRFNVIYYAEVPTGTSGTVVCTFSTSFGNSTLAYLSSVSMYGLSSTTPITGFSYDDATGRPPSRSVTLTPNANSVLFAGYSCGAFASGSTVTWTNATEQSEVIDGNVLYTDAIESGLANSSITITCTNTDTSVNRPALVVATWA